jgi:hypothetical protein
LSPATSMRRVRWLTGTVEVSCAFRWGLCAGQSRWPLARHRCSTAGLQGVAGRLPGDPRAGILSSMRWARAARGGAARCGADRMLLSGKRGASEVDIAAFLGACRVNGSERERLLALCREQDTPGWFQQHGSWLPTQLVTLIDHENKAATIDAFEAIFVNVPPEEVNDRVAARLARQSLFRRDRPARFTFYLHESVLRTPVGGRAVMAEQLRHLRRMSTRSYLTLRMVPVALGAHAAIAPSLTDSGDFY